MHPFEKAGLGKAPFQCKRVTEEYIQYPDGTTKAGGCCDYCGTGIRWMYHIVSSDSKRFHVGCDCVQRVGAEVEDFKKIRLELARTRRQAGVALRKAERQAKWEAEWEANKKEKYAEFCIENGELVKQIESYSGDNEFIQSIKFNLAKWGKLSPNQVKVAIDSFNREARNESLKTTSKFIGMTGDKIKMPATVIFSKQIGNTTFYPYAPKFLVKLITDDGSLLTWFTNRGYHMDDKASGFTVKSHEEYNDVKQTIVQRVKMEV